MPFDLEMPDGTVIQDVPDGTTKAQIQTKYSAHINNGRGSPGILSDMAHAAPEGLAKGLTGLAGIPGDISNLVNRGMSAMGIPTRDPSKPLPLNVTLPGGDLAFGAQPNSTEAYEQLPGEKYVAQTTPGKITDRIASFLPAVAGGTPGLGTRLLGRAVAPGIGSVAGEHLGDDNSPNLRTAGQIGGALLGSGIAGGLRVGVPALGNKMADLLLGKAGSVNPNAADLAGKAAGLGIDIRPGQLSPNRFTNTADDQLSRLPFTGYGDAGPKISTEAQNTQFTRALGKTIGVNADALTPDVVSKAKGDIGTMFNKGLEGVTLSAKPETDKAFTSIKDGIEDIQPALTSEDYRRLTGTLSKIKDSVLNGLTGEQYQSMRQRGGLLDSLSNDANPTVANLGKTMRETLDDAFQAQAPADKAELIGQARQLYRNFKVIEPLADKAPLGNISPQLVLGQVNKAYPNLATAGDIGDLGRIGQSFLKVPSNSNTAERSLVLSAIKNPLKAVGELASMPVAATVGRGLGAAINSKAAMARLLADPAATQIAQTPKLLPRLLMMK